MRRAGGGANEAGLPISREGGAEAEEGVLTHGRRVAGGAGACGRGGGVGAESRRGKLEQHLGMADEFLALLEDQRPHQAVRPDESE